MLQLTVPIASFPGKDPIQKVSLAVSDLQRSVHYWSSLLGMKVIEKNEAKKTVLMGFSDNQVWLKKDRLNIFLAIVTS